MPQIIYSGHKERITSDELKAVRSRINGGYPNITLTRRVKKAAKQIVLNLTNYIKLEH